MPHHLARLTRLLLITILAVVVAACNRSTAETPSPTAQPAAAAVTQGSPAAPASTPTPLSKETTVITDSGLQYTEVTAGAGPKPATGQVVSVHYTGTLEDGTVFDSSHNRGEPIRFALGMGMVIPGWDEGIALMNQGGQAILVIPPDLAYGSQGAGGVIPPNATLVFDVELVDVFAGAPNAPTDVDESAYTTNSRGIKYADLVPGAGPTPMPGQMIVVHYTGWLETGGKFDSSLDRGEPFVFNIGMGQVIPGWDFGVAGMQVGGKRQLVIPPNMAYGEQGAGGVIPPNATLIFEVELLEVR